MKINVEGYELSVLRGSRRLLDEKLVKRFVIKVHTDVVRSDDIESFLKNHG